MAEGKQVALVQPLQLQEMQRDQGPRGGEFFLPMEVIKVLKPTRHKAEPTGISVDMNKERRPLSTAVAPGVPGPPANLWFFPKQRQRFRHLLKDTICDCGAGQDLSFLYDASQFVPREPYDAEATRIHDKSDPSVVRKELLQMAVQRTKNKTKATSDDKLPNVLPMDGIQLVQHVGVQPVEVCQSEMSALDLKEHRSHPALLPAMQPTSRQQAKLLRETLDDLLEGIGFGSEREQPTQLHHLLEIVKQEQDVYNTVFHELIRQITVECYERGDLMAVLRNKYNELINRIPKQILSLHHEILAQKALDNSLVEELVKFRANITQLTKDLQRARNHDKMVTEQARDMEVQLRDALRRSDKTDALIDEFRLLYEMQRQRLESRITILIEERDVWVNTAYMVAGKVIAVNGLSAANNALYTERSWNAMAVHFSALLSDKDAGTLMQISQLVHKVEVECGNISAFAASEAERIRSRLEAVKQSMSKTAERRFVGSADDMLQQKPSSPTATSTSILKKRQKRKTEPDAPEIGPLVKEVFYDRVRRWLDVITELSETMSGDSLLRKRQRCDDCRKNFVTARELALELYHHHKAADGGDMSSRAIMSRLTRSLPTWLEAIFTQMAGDGGEGAALAKLTRDIETWLTLMTTEQVIYDPNKSQALIASWMRRIDDCLQIQDNSLKVPLPNLSEIIEQLSNWVAEITSQIGGDNSVLYERAKDLHLVWMQLLAQTLARLVPDQDEIPDDLRLRGEKFLMPVDQVLRAAINLGRASDAFTELMTTCLRDKVAGHYEDTQALMQLHTDLISWLEATWQLLHQLLPDPPPLSKWMAASLPLVRLRAAINCRPFEDIPESDNLYYASSDVIAAAMEASLAQQRADEDAEDDFLASFDGQKKSPSRLTRSEMSRRQRSDLSNKEKTEDLQAKKPQDDKVTWVTAEGALFAYTPEQAPEERQHLKTMTPGLDSFLPDTQRTASAISIVEQLTDQLTETEERCRQLEARARAAEMKLGDAEDKIRLFLQGPPLPEGQEWRMNDDPEFASIFEKIKIAVQALTPGELDLSANPSTPGSAVPSASTDGDKKGHGHKGGHGSSKASTPPKSSTAGSRKKK